MGSKKWNKPEIIVLVRGRADENILVNCKMTTSEGTGATVIDCSRNGFRDGTRTCDNRSACSRAGTT
jgi:hypothetical protein